MLDIAETAIIVDQKCKQNGRLIDVSYFKIILLMNFWLI
jgi:hypothetical protein